MMLILSSQMYKYDMEWLLIMMDHTKINKYQAFFMILPNLPTIFLAIYDNQSHITQLTLEMSYMTIWHNYHDNNNMNVYLHQLQQLIIPANVKLIIPPNKMTRWLTTMASIASNFSNFNKAYINTSNQIENANNNNFKCQTGPITKFGSPTKCYWTNTI